MQIKRLERRKKINMKKILIIGIVLLYVLGTFTLFVAADDTAYAQSLIQQKIPCSQLNQTQLISIGDYYMSQVFSPQQHEYMDNMMGGDSSPMAEQMHIAFAYRYYCNSSGYPVSNDSDNYPSYGYGMMGGEGYGYGMMGGYGYALGYNGQRAYQAYSPWYDNIWIVLGLAVLLALLAGVVAFLALRFSGKRKKRR